MINKGNVQKSLLSTFHIIKAEFTYLKKVKESSANIYFFISFNNWLALRDTSVQLVSLQRQVLWHLQLLSLCSGQSVVTSRVNGGCQCQRWAIVFEFLMPRRSWRLPLLLYAGMRTTRKCNEMQPLIHTMEEENPWNDAESSRWKNSSISPPKKFS